MATQEKTWNVANRLHSQKDSDNPEVNHIIAGADEIYDDAKGAKQSDINAQTDAALADRYTKTETYSKEQLDSLITTPDVNYVSVVATNATTAVTDILPATGEANTIYRVGNWNGTQYDPTMYALYAWNGSAYVCLTVRSFVGEVYDISVNHPDGQGNPTPYADLAAALGTNGANIPADIRRGGMSIKFIKGNAQSSDNKYVQYRLMATAWSTNTENWTIAEEGVLIENSKFIYVKTDAEDKILWGIKTDGDVYYGVGVPQQIIDYVKEKIAELSLDEYGDIVAFLADYLGSDTTLKVMIDGINAAKVDKIEGKSLIDTEYADGVSQIENPEFAEAHTDADDKVLYGVKQDGDFYFGAGIPSQIQKELDNKANSADLADLGDNKVDKEEGKSLIDEEVSESLFAIEDPEGRGELTTDAEEKIISYRDNNGVLHENSGIMTPLIGEIKTDDIAKRSFILNRPREYDLPKYGNVKMEKELTYTDGSNNYKPSQITKVGSQYYVTSTLVDGQVVESSVEISIQENDIVLSQWPVNKDTKHYLKVSIDFNQYLSGVFYIEVKYQGHSTLNYPKKNFRFTFYKDILFSKKLKIKIGELIPASKFNLKAYWLDFTLIREHACYRIVQAIRETHSYGQQYPWNSSYPFNTQATGISNGFPINVEVSGEFRGIYWFCLAKDMNNFMLDDELMNGVCVQGDGGYSDTTFWQVLNPTEWSDLLADIDYNIGEDSLPYFQAFYDYLNGGNFNRETAHTHFDIKNWVDCFIILQMLGCTDLTNSNIILYAGEDKTIFSPMYYDMDWSFGINCRWDMSTFDNSQTSDQSLWRKIQSVFREDIKQRYKELRGSIINMQFLTSLITSISRQIPYSDYEKELERWPNSSQYSPSWERRGTISEILNWIEKRITFMNGFFNV